MVWWLKAFKVQRWYSQSIGTSSWMFVRRITVCPPFCRVVVYHRVPVGWNSGDYVECDLCLLDFFCPDLCSRTSLNAHTGWLLWWRIWRWKVYDCDVPRKLMTYATAIYVVQSRTRLFFQLLVVQIILFVIMNLPFLNLHSILLLKIFSQHFGPIFSLSDTKLHFYIYLKIYLNTKMLFSLSILFC